MKKSTWKFPLKKVEDMELEIPKGAKILALQTQRETPCIWAEVNTKAKKKQDISLHMVQDIPYQIIQ